MNSDGRLIYAQKQRRIDDAIALQRPDSVHVATQLKKPPVLTVEWALPISN